MAAGPNLHPVHTRVSFYLSSQVRNNVNGATKHNPAGSSAKCHFSSFDDGPKQTNPNTNVVSPCNGTTAGQKKPIQTPKDYLIGRPKYSLGTYQSTGTNSSSDKSTVIYCNKTFNDHMNKMSRADNAEIDIVFITERILVATFPSTGTENAYRNSLKNVSRMLKTKHSNKYKIFNVSKRRHDLCKLNENVAEYGWPEELAPPLDRLCAICKDIENWLSINDQHIVVIHSKGGRSRPGVVVAAYMHYTNICASDDQALDRFAMKRFSDDYVGGIAQPSHRRYVSYFSTLLTGATRINSNPIFLQHMNVTGLPPIEGNGSTPYIKIYEKMVPVYASGVFLTDSDVLSVPFTSPLALRGDVLLKCFHRSNSSSGHNRRLLFRCQFNTCALEFRDGVGINRIIFEKPDLDEACYDRAFAPSAKIELLFSLSGEKLPVNATPPSKTLEPPFSRTDSYENFEQLHEDADQAESWSDFDNSNSIETPVLSLRQGESQTLPVTLNGQLYASVHKTNESTDSGISADTPRYSSNPGHHQNEHGFPVNWDQLNGALSNQTNPGHNPHLTNSVNTSATQINGQLAEEPPIVKVVKKRVDLESTKDQLFRVFGSSECESSDLSNGDINESLFPNGLVLKTEVKTAAAPPPPPPKRTTQTAEYDNRPPQHSVLPAGIKRPLSPPQATPTPEPQAPLIDVELVGEDRYDPQSKAFAYVPSKALTDHFKRPKKQTRLVRRLEDQEGKEIILSEAPPLSILPDTMSKQKNVVEHKAANEEHEVIELEAEDPDVEVEVVEVVEPKKVKSKTRKTKFNAYRTLDDYSSDMDDLCDPEFYLTYTSSSTLPPAQTRPVDTVVHKPKLTVELPKKSPAPPANVPSTVDSTNSSLLWDSRDISGAKVLDEWSSPKLMDTPKSAPVRPASSWSDAIDNDDWITSPQIQRSTRSVTSTPIQKRNPMASNVRQFSFSSTYSDMDPDEWLDVQLERLRWYKEQNDPELRRRREQEKLLLEELKHVNDDRMAARNRDEADYSVEGVGTRVIDPLEELRLEEERLKTLQSPYNTGHRSLPARVHPSSSQQHPYVRGKPPTPPPRERSRTPPSPRRMSPVMPRRSGRYTPPTQEVQVAPPPPYIHQAADEDQVDKSVSAPFDRMEQLLWDTPQSATVAKRQNSQEMVVTPRSTGPFQQSPKSILKKPKSASSNGSVPNGTVPGTTVRNRAIAPERQVDTGQRQPPQYSEVVQNRPETPNFPIRNPGSETPVPYHPLLFEGAEVDPRSPGQPRTPVIYQRPINYRSPSPGSMYYGQSRASSVTSLEPMEVIHHHPVFVKDTSKYWYKPNISREEAINLLKDKPPGTFIVRDSNSFPGAFGLALKVVSPPPGVHTKSDGTELVRHFLIEPSSKGVKLKGCNNEPIFGSLSALVYQHSITPLALPAKLLLPDYDPTAGPEHVNAAQALLEQGAACNMTYIHCCDTESLTGPEAVRRVTDQAFSLISLKQISPVSVHFKVACQGITLTDNTRKLFFRRHYPVASVTFCGLDPEDRRWSLPAPVPDGVAVVKDARIFGFVARKIGSRTDNCCHLFAELEPEQPATAVVNFVTKVMMNPLQQTGNK